jgi:hypothetical protein
MKRVNAFELVDHGIDHSQYFQGCGTSFTEFDYVITGVGDNPAEAIDDCLDQIVMAGFDADDLEKRILESEGWEEFPAEPSAICESETEEDGSDYEDMDGNEVFYYVSIMWR